MTDLEICKCAGCGIGLSSNDKVYIDFDDCIYCSLNCLYGSNHESEIIVKA